MRQVAIIGTGMTQVGEHWQLGLRDLGADALRQALDDAKLDKVDAVYVGNAYGATFSSQSQVGPLVTDFAGLAGVETFAIDAADASGAAALRAGYLAVASGLLDTVVVMGVEKSTDAIGSTRVRARSVSMDAEYEAVHGATLNALAGLLMRRYMHEYGVSVTDFEGFSINAHRNGSKASHAMFRNTVRAGAFSKAPMVSDPVNLFDGAPDADGAAALVLTSAERAMDLSPKPVLIAGSGAGSDTFALQDRSDLLYFTAAALSMEQALRGAGIGLDAIDVFELHDSFTIVSALALEAVGFAQRGEGWHFAADEGAAISLSGKLPVATFGGLKSRGNPVGATGIYQALEAVKQIRGEAGDNQVMGAETIAVQNFGGLATTAITHILQPLR